MARNLQVIISRDIAECAEPERSPEGLLVDKLHFSHCSIFEGEFTICGSRSGRMKRGRAGGSAARRQVDAEEARLARR